MSPIGSSILTFGPQWVAQWGDYGTFGTRGLPGAGGVTRVEDTTRVVSLPPGNLKRIIDQSHSSLGSDESSLF